MNNLHCILEVSLFSYDTHKKLSSFALLLLKGFKKLFQVEKVSGIQIEDLEKSSHRPTQCKLGELHS